MNIGLVYDIVKKCGGVPENIPQAISELEKEFTPTSLSDNRWGTYDYLCKTHYFKGISQTLNDQTKQWEYDKHITPLDIFIHEEDAYNKRWLKQEMCIDQICVYLDSRNHFHETSDDILDKFDKKYKGLKEFIFGNKIKYIRFIKYGL